MADQAFPQQINLVCATTSGTGTVTANGIAQLDTTQYSGSPTYWFEAVFNGAASNTGTIKLRDIAAASNVASLSGATSTTYTTSRVQFTPTAGAREYTLQIVGDATRTQNVHSARILVLQSEPAITGTETQIEIGNDTSAAPQTNTAVADITNPKFWKYNSANWDGAKTFYVEVVWKTSAKNTATITLCRTSDNTTNTTIVSAGTNSTGFTRTRVVFTPVNGETYKIRALSSTTKSSYSVACAKIIINRTAIDSGINTLNSLTSISFGNITGNDLVGQSFTVGAANLVLGSISVMLHITGSPSDNVFIDVSDSIGGTALGTSASVPGSSIPGGGNKNFVRFDFSSVNLTLTASTKYYYRLNRSGSLSNTDFYSYDGANTNIYSGGGAYTHANGGAWSSESATNDQGFVISYGDAFTKFELQFLLLNTSDAGTGAQNMLATYNASEWGIGTGSNTITHLVDSDNASNSAKIVTSAGADTGTSSAATGSVQPESSSFSLIDATNYDTNVTNSTGTVAGSRLKFVYVFVGAAGTAFTHAETAALAFVGAQTKSAGKRLAGALSFIGANNRSLRFVRSSFTGALSFNNSGTGYSRTLTVDHTQVPSTQTDFPVLVSVTDAALKNVADGGHVQNGNGYDIQFFSDTGLTTKLSWEIEKWDSSTGELVAWVKIPSLSSVADTVFYLNYGNPLITSDQSDPTGVWDSNYKAVYHLATGPVVNTLDSTSNAHNGTNSGTQVIDTSIGKGAYFSGENTGGTHDKIATNSITNSGAPTATIEFLIAPQSIETVLTKDEWVMTMGSTNNPFFQIRAGGPSGSQAFRVASNKTDHLLGSVFTDNAMHHILIAADASESRLYIDGALEGASPFAALWDTGSNLFPTAALVLGNSPIDLQYFKGILKEVRMSSSKRTASWAAASSNNQLSASTFYSVGSFAGGANGFTKQSTLTIDHTKCGSADSSNFPVYFSITDANLKHTSFGGSVTSLSGYDIIPHTDSGLSTRANFELRSYDPASGTVTFWAKVATLSASADTLVYLGAGKSSITTDQSDKTNVFDSNYLAVLHLDQDVTPGLNTRDSTANLNTGANNGATTGTGKIDGGASMVATSSQYVNLGTGSSLNITGTALTLSAWVKPSSGTTTGYEYVVTRRASPTTRAHMLWCETNNVRMAVCDGSNFDVAQGATTLSTGIWYYLTGVKNGTGANALKAYLNGAQDASVTSNFSIPSVASDVRIGDSQEDHGGFFDGILDEVRISNVARSANWITTEYNNQSAPGTFLTTGSETPLGLSNLTKRISKALAAALSFIGDLATFLSHSGGALFTQAVSGTLSFAGAFSRRSNKSISGSLSFVGAITKRIARALSGAALSFTGSLTRRTARSLTGALSFVGVGARKALKVFAGTLSFIGSITFRTAKGLAAALSFVGSLTKRLARSLTGALSFVGVGARKALKVFAGTLSFIGSITFRTAKGLAAALSFVGSLTKRLARSLTGALSFVGAFFKSSRKVLAGSLSFVGAIVRKTLKTISGSLSFIGDFIGSLVGGATHFTQALTASLSFSGDITRRTAHKLTAAALSFVGAMVKQTNRTVSGALSFVGALAKRSAFARSFTAALSFVGTVRKSIRTSLASALSFIGDLATQLSAGAHQYLQALTGALSFSGTTSKRTPKAFTAALSFVGATLKRAGKVFQGTLTFAGAIRRAVSSALSAALSFSGLLAKRTYLAFTAAISFIGDLLAELNPAHLYLVALEATLDFAGSIQRSISVGLESVLRFSGLRRFHRLARHLCRVFASGARNPGFPDRTATSQPTRLPVQAPSAVVSSPDRDATDPPHCR